MAISRVTSRNPDLLVGEINRSLGQIEGFLQPSIAEATPLTTPTVDGFYGEECVVVDKSVEGTDIRLYKRLLNEDRQPRWYRVPVRMIEVDYRAFDTITVTNTVTETTLLSRTASSWSLPSVVWKYGTTFQFQAWGVYSTQAVPVTLRARVYLNNVAIGDTTALATVGGLANRLWGIRLTLTCRALGTSGLIFAQGVYEHMQAAGAAAPIWWPMANTAGTVIDTTREQVFDLTVAWGAGVAAADTISCTHAYLNLVN
mgnify:CR=1 FL=1